MLVSLRAHCWNSPDWMRVPGAGKGLFDLVDTKRHPGVPDRAAEDAALSALLVQCGQGDRAAFRRLYDLESKRLYGLALRITRQPALAADAVHDALLQAWQGAARFDPARGSVAAWLTGLVRYRAIDVMRKRAREVTGVDLPDEADETPGALDRLLAGAAGRALHRCLDGLEQRQRQVIVMAFVEGLSHADLAVRLESPLGTVKSWIRRGLQALKVCLDS
ncbi:MAG TPA: sigma-70 family RNA polymerase sigma factor [Acetobacteraceae bacterium]|jgi:RNA polymerase sigma-70 factor, ECF subfamily|nr:sigma-70 family RNA polymerase sigma factor [Acetobacteraceae bacterium]